MKRRISLLLAVVMVLGSFGAVFAADAKDEVTLTEEKAAAFLDEKGILKGNMSGDLELDKNFLRRDSVIMLSRLMGVEEEAKGHETTDAFGKFLDITDKFYNGYISWAVEKEYFVGKTETKFGFNENITVRDYSVVILRALGYGEEVKGEEGWKKAFDKAKELGLTKGLEVKADDEILRGQMALMTVNALNTKVKGSDKTLAEELKIELPKPEVLGVEVYSNNLKEIEVKYNRDVEKDVVTNKENYSTLAGTIEDVRLEEGNLVVITLQGTMKNNAEYVLNIKNIDENVNKEHKFKTVDNAVPTVEKVEGLGTKGIRITMSEPVKDAQQNKFRLNDSAFYGNVATVGREITLRPYSGSFPVGANKLTVQSLEDFAGFKSIASSHEFDIAEDLDAPKVVSIKAIPERVVVEFDKAFDPSTVSVNTIYWGNSASNRPNSFKVLDSNRVEFTYTTNKVERGDTKMVVRGVKNFSGVQMTDHEQVVTVELDVTRPTIMSAELVDGEFVVKFDKDMNKSDATNINNFALLDRAGKKMGLNAPTYDVATKTAKIKPRVTLEEGETYTFVVKNLRDTSYLQNMLSTYEKSFKGELVGNVEVAAISTKKDTAGKVEYIDVVFNRVMNTATLTNPANYTLAEVNVGGSIVKLFDFEKIGGKIDLMSSGRAVRLYVPSDYQGESFNNIIISGSVRDTANNLVKGFGTPMSLDLSNINVDIKSAKAVANNKVEVEFSHGISSAAAADFIVYEVGTTVDPVGPKYDIANVQVSGKLVTIELSKALPSSVRDASDKAIKVGVVAKNSIVNDLGVSVKEISSDLEDKIRPSIVNNVAGDYKAEKVGTDLKITLTADEALSNIHETRPEFTNGISIVVKGSEVMNIDGIVTAKLVTGNKIEITLDGSKIPGGVTAGDSVLVEVNNAQLVIDNNFNTVNNTTVTLQDVVK